MTVKKRLYGAVIGLFCSTASLMVPAAELSPRYVDADHDLVADTPFQGLG